VVTAEPGHVLVRADLGQIEPRVLAAVSGDRALAAANRGRRPVLAVAARLEVARPVAKVAVLAAMYGQTSGARGRRCAVGVGVPTAMRYLRDAYEQGRPRPRRCAPSAAAWSGSARRPPAGRLGAAHRGGGAGAVRAQRRRAGSRRRGVQGVGGDRARQGRRAGRRIVLCLHDELLLHVPTEHGPAAAELLHTCLAEAAAAGSRPPRCGSSPTSA